MKLRQLKLDNQVSRVSALKLVESYTDPDAHDVDSDALVGSWEEAGKERALRVAH
jgi:hypothetical protein